MYVHCLAPKVRILPSLGLDRVMCVRKKNADSCNADGINFILIITTLVFYIFTTY